MLDGVGARVAVDVFAGIDVEVAVDVLVEVGVSLVGKVGVGVLVGARLPFELGVGAVKSC